MSKKMLWLAVVAAIYACSSAHAFIDTDGDGLSDTWEAHYFGDLTSLERGDTVDNDSDGHTDYQEGLARTDPVSSTYKPGFRFFQEYDYGDELEIYANWTLPPGMSGQFDGKIGGVWTALCPVRTNSYLWPPDAPYNTYYTKIIPYTSPSELPTEYRLRMWVNETDNDNLDDNEEWLAGTKSYMPDSDGDGLQDGWEIALFHETGDSGYNPLIANSDVNGNGVLDSWDYASALAKLYMPNNAAAGNYFGTAVEISGDRMIVGSYGTGGTEGSVHIYEEGLNGWEEVATFDSRHDGMAFLGMSVDIDGNWAFAGAFLPFNSELGSSAYAGYVNVYRRGSDGTWQFSEELHASQPQQFDYFGFSVNVEGDYLYVSAPTSQPRGKMNVFKRNGLVWSVDGVIDGPADAYEFGWWHTVHNGRLVVSNEVSQDNTNKTNRYYVFDRSGSTWTQNSTIERELDDSTSFGFRVEAFGDLLFVGASRADATGLSHESGVVRAYKYNVTAGQYELFFEVYPPVAEQDSNFGSGIAINDNLLFVSQPQRDGVDAIGGTLTDVGVVHAFAFDEVQGVATKVFEYVSIPDATGVPETETEFGFDVATSGEWVAVPDLDSNIGGSNAGKLTMYRIPLPVSWTADGDNDGATFEFEAARGLDPNRKDHPNVQLDVF